MRASVPTAVSVTITLIGLQWRYRLKRYSNTDKEIAMNWDTIEGNWKQLKGKVKEQWGKLTDDHIDTIAGKRDQLSGKIQEAYGVSKDAADAQIDDFAKRNQDRKAN